jgi:hypothetical protein
MYVVPNMNTHTDSPPRNCSELILSSFVRTVTLDAIDNHDLTDIAREDHPMALLDALYARVLSRIPTKIAIKYSKVVVGVVIRL